MKSIVGSFSEKDFSVERCFAGYDATHCRKITVTQLTVSSYGEGVANRQLTENEELDYSSSLFFSTRL